MEEDNSTGVLQGDIVCDSVLSEEGGGVNDTRLDTYLNSSDVVKYYHGPECYGAYLCDGDGNVLANKTVSFLINGVVYNRVTDGEGYAFSLNAPAGDTPNSTGGTWKDVAEYIKELYDEFKSLDTTHEKIIFIKNNILKIFTISIKFETIDLIEDLINLLLYELSQDTYNNSTNPSGG